MRNLLWFSPVLLAVFLLPGTPAGVARETAQEEPDAEVPSAEVPLKIPDAEKNRPNPIRSTPESIRHGEELFTTQCTMCHGVRGDGKGDLVERLGFEPPDFTDPATQQRRKDGELFYILTHGHGDMPGEGDRLQDEWKWDLVNYIRTLSRRG